MTLPPPDASRAPSLPDYVPVPRASLGPAVNDLLGAVDVFSVPTAFSILESIRLDLGYRMDVHP
jgi:hypothetical protein